MSFDRIATLVTLALAAGSVALATISALADYPGARTTLGLAPPEAPSAAPLIVVLPSEPSRGSSDAAARRAEAEPTPDLSDPVPVASTPDPDGRLWMQLLNGRDEPLPGWDEVWRNLFR